MEARWKILCLLFVTRIALGFQFQVVGSITPELVNTLQLDYRQVGILVGLFLFAGVFISFPAGLAHRYMSDKTLVLAGLSLLGIGGILSSLSSGFALIAFGRIVSGAGFVFSTLYFTKMVADWFSGKELATAMAVLVMSWPLGIALGQVLHPMMAQMAGISATFKLASVYCIFAVLMLWWFYQSPRSRYAETPAAPSVWGISRHHLKLTLIAALVWALFNAAYVVYLSFVTEVLSNQGFSDQRAVVVGSIPSWTMVISAIVIGQFVDRTGRRDLILNCGLVVSAICFVLVSLGAGVYFSILLLGTIGFGCAGVIMSLTGDAMPADARAFGMGAFFTLYFVVGLPAPGIAGWLFDISGDSVAPMVFGGSLCLLAAGCNYWFRACLDRQRSSV